MIACSRDKLSKSERKNFFNESSQLGDLLSYPLRPNHHSREDHTDIGISFEGAVLGIGKSVVAEAQKSEK